MPPAPRANGVPIIDASYTEVDGPAPGAVVIMAAADRWLPRSRAVAFYSTPADLYARSQAGPAGAAKGAHIDVHA